MNWTAFWQTGLLLVLIHIAAFVNLKVFGTPVEVFLLSAILCGLIYNDLVRA